MGYLNRFIDLPFPDLAGVDDNGRAIVWVKIRNPRLIPAEDLAGAASKVRLDEHGKPVDAAAASDDMFATFARLVIAGNVWDATSIEDDAPLIPMPPTATDMGKMPMEILNAIGRELSALNPQ